MLEATANVAMIRIQAMGAREEVEEAAERVAPEEESSLFPQRRLPIMQPFLQTEETPRQGAPVATGEVHGLKAAETEGEETEEAAAAAEGEEAEEVSLFSHQP